MSELAKLIFDIAAEEVTLLGIKRGHRNKGTGFDSFRMAIEGNAVVCYMLDYMLIVDKGFDKSKASFKQFPFVVRYFESKGLSEKEAKNAAGATINKWISEQGMSTKDSSRFSGDNKRNSYIVDGLENARQRIRKVIINYVNNEFKEGTEGLRV